MKRRRKIVSLLIVSNLTSLASSLASPFYASGVSRASKLNDKDTFLQSLDFDDRLNQPSQERTALLNRVIANKQEVSSSLSSASKDGTSALSLQNPGSSFGSVAPGRWRVIYAPHMSTIAGLFRGEFRVQYDLYEDGTMESHARYDFFKQQGYLSVSGTYGSVDDNYCRVDFDQAWVKHRDDGGPYKQIDDVPDSLSKSVINSIGKAMFIKEFSVFPVSFLDEDLIVFDFELLGTRICARRTRWA